MPSERITGPHAIPRVVLERDLRGIARMYGCEHVRRHADAIEWGFYGDGARDCALSILSHLADESTAERWYERAARSVIAKVPLKGATFFAEDMRSWLRQFEFEDDLFKQLDGPSAYDSDDRGGLSHVVVAQRLTPDQQAKLTDMDHGLLELPARGAFLDLELVDVIERIDDGTVLCRLNKLGLAVQAITAQIVYERDERRAERERKRKRKGRRKKA